MIFSKETARQLMFKTFRSQGSLIPTGSASMIFDAQILVWVNASSTSMRKLPYRNP